MLICGWSLDASAALTIGQNPFDAGTELIGVQTSNSTSLASSSNIHVDLVITNNCAGGGGTFSFQDFSNLNLNPSVTITIRYTPSARGTRTCRVDIFEAGTMNLLGSFNVRGTGEAPATMDTSGLTDFGSVRWNDGAPGFSFSRTYTVQNNGDRSFDLSSITLSNTTDWSVSGPAVPTTIAGGQAKSWTITFNPAGGGAKTAVLTFNGDAPNDSSDTFNLTGNGTNAVISVNATLLDYGIVNTGSSAPVDIAVVNSGATPKGNLGVRTATIADPNNSGWFSFTGSCSGQSCDFIPDLSIANSANVSIRCSPPGTAAAGAFQTATVTFVSDTDSGTANVANLKCTAGKSDLSTNMNVVAFAPQLVSMMTGASTVMITNNGNIAATFYLSKTGANAGQFTLSTPTGCGLTGTLNQCGIGIGGTASFTVAFTPGIEGDVAAGVTITPTPGSPVQVTLTGRGIDRHIEMADAAQAPETYRNPGSQAPMVHVPITNAGEYPLRIKNVQLEGNGNWELATGFEPFDVPGLGTINVDLLFKPVTAGKAPDATLVVMSDDPKSLMNTVVVSGNGKDRMCEWGPQVDFGNRGAGVPVKLTELKASDHWPAARNIDGADFKIRKITSDMPDVFEVRMIDGSDVDNVEFPVDGYYKFEVIFHPSEVGDYNGNIGIYLDEDPVPQLTIPAHGNALFVDARGGAGFGCSTGSGAGSGMIMVVLGLVLRRKRRRA